MTELLPFIGLLALAGALAGLIAGLLGVGGGIVLVPAYFYIFSALGYDGPLIMQVCLATSLATIVVTSLRSVISHNRRGAVDWSILKSWAPYIASGALLGVLIASGLRTVTLMFIFGFLGLGIGMYLMFGKSDWKLADTMPTGFARAVTGTLIGFLSVLMGIGGGSLGVPLMTLHAIPIHRAVATSAGFGAIIAIPSVLGFLVTGLGAEGRPPYTVGLVNIPAFAIVVALTLITAPLGASLAHALPPKPLRRVFAVFIILMAANMMRKALGT